MATPTLHCAHSRYRLCVRVAESCLTVCGPMDHIARQSPLSMGFSKQEYWSRLVAVSSSSGSFQVTEESLFALVLDTLLLQLVVFADICKVLWSVMVLALSQGVGRLPSSMSSWACPDLLCSSQLWEVSIFMPLLQRGQLQFRRGTDLQWWGACPPEWSGRAATRGGSGLPEGLERWPEVGCLKLWGRAWCPQELGVGGVGAGPKG